MFRGKTSNARRASTRRFLAPSFLVYFLIQLSPTIVSEEADFEHQIAPLLTRECIECHNPKDQKGGLDLTTLKGIQFGGESGPVIDPEHPEHSLILTRLKKGQMPPKDRGKSRALPPQEVARFERWIRDGTQWTPERTLSLFDRTTERRAGRDWWALQAIKRPQIPAQDLNRPIDYLIQKKLATHQFKPAKRASKRQLIRRASYDLRGLPPSLTDVLEFEADETPGAYERLIDQLLSSPHYGERWGRHWLDVVRFAETDGYERDRIKPNAWRYRDWVIDAFNRDIDYPSFVTEQLAGDEVPNRNESSVIATGMLRMGTWNDEPNDPADYQYERLEDMVHTTSSAFLGLTIKCARCHDHKFDPILQSDYYRVGSYFWAGPIGQGNQGGPSAEQLGYNNVYGWTDKGPTVEPIRLLIKGDRLNPGPEITPSTPAIFPQLERLLSPPKTGSKTTHRRLQFSQWIVDTLNPLTPRVMVNRIWQHHFGQGLVRTPNNFGFKSAPPSHPRLLDWLAAEFTHPTMSAGGPWTIKRIHKLIMLSDTYQQSSIHTEHEHYSQQDSENRLLWRFPRLRLDAESLRDSILTASGALNRTMKGPSFFPRMSHEAMDGLSRKEAAWKESAAAERARRSVYMMTQRSRLLPMMTTFDFTETTSTCAKRDVTTVAPQALALLNNEFVHRQSTALANRVRLEAGNTPTEQIIRAWEITLQRTPSPLELSQALDHLSEQRESFSAAQNPKPTHQALQSLCHVLFNTNEFLYLD